MTMNSFFKRISNEDSGQAMVLTTVMLGGLMLIATSIAGLLMFYQLKQANDAASSAAGIFAADAGLEAVLDCYYHSTEVPVVPSGGENYCLRSIVFPPSPDGNAASLNASISFSLDNSIPPQVVGFTGTGYGFSGQAERVLQNSFSTR
jgi:hypothetical protein